LTKHIYDSINLDQHLYTENMFDPVSQRHSCLVHTASFCYSLVFHFTLIVTWFYIEHPPCNELRT